MRARNAIERLAVRAMTSRPGVFLSLRVFPHLDRWLLWMSRGRLSVFVGKPILLLTTKGARSGRLRTTPLLYGTDGPDLVLVASKGGAAHHPAWYHNLRANPEVDVLAGRRTGRYLAREASGAERDRLWAQSVDRYGGYGTYQQRAGTRQIPVVVLSPVNQ